MSQQDVDKSVDVRKLVDSGRYDEALPKLEQLLAINPEDPGSNYFCAYCLHITGRNLEAALEHYNKALEKGFDEFWVCYHRAQLLMLLGNKGAALNDLLLAKKLQPKNTGVDTVLEQLLFNKDISLKDEIDSLRMTLDRLEQQIIGGQVSIDVLREGQAVNLVDFGTIKLFMYEDDLAYKQLPAHMKKGQSSLDVVASSRDLGLTAYSMHTVTDGNLILHLLDHYWRENIDFTVIDVGCRYGAIALETGRFIKLSNKQNRVLCFDPGQSGELTKYNIKINDLEHRVVFEPLAVSSTNYPAIVFFEKGHPENNRIVNRYRQIETKSRVVDCVTIDDYVLRNNIGGHFIIKIDTQGADYEVIKGMRTVIDERIVTYIVEFTPAAIEYCITGEDFLSAVGNSSFVFELRMSDPDADGRRIRFIDPATYPEFAAEVSSSAQRWTDLLVIPEKLPGADALIRKLAGS